MASDFNTISFTIRGDTIFERKRKEQNDGKKEKNQSKRRIERVSE